MATRYKDLFNLKFESKLKGNPCVLSNAITHLEAGRLGSRPRSAVNGFYNVG